MKKLAILGISAIAFTACNDNSAELARLQQQRSMDSIRLVMQEQQAEAARQRSIDSLNAIAAEEKAASAQREASAARSARRSSGTNYSSTTYTGNAASAAPATQQRKGWSGAAKGAAIGAGVGAVSGALIDDRKGRGAIIGGLAGAGIGAGTGAIVDDAKKKKGK